MKDRKEFDLKVRLYHGYESKKIRRPVLSILSTNLPVLIQRGTWDINLNLPVVVFWSREEFIDIDEEANLEKVGEDSLDEGSNRTVHSIMETFNLTWKEALEEFITYTYKAGDAEGGAIWL